MLDIRIPIGFLFSVLGVLLTIYGLTTSGNADMYTKSFSINVNLWSGIGMLLFGGIMLLTTKLGKKKDK